jgi:hypothetical protein
VTSSPSLTWIERHPLVGAVLWAAVPSSVALFAAPYVPQEELRKVLYAGAGTLLFGGLLGGVLKLMLDEVAVTKRRREDAATFVTNVLSDLKSVYDRAATSQLLIAAHRSAKTYGDELRGLIEASVQLRNVKRALDGRADGVAESTRKDVVAEVERMSRYLADLTDEFRQNYKELSDSQRSYEAKAEALVKEFASAVPGSAPPALPSFVWDRIAGLPHLKDFIANGENFKRGFDDPLIAASRLLRAELARVLRRTGARHSLSNP